MSITVIPKTLSLSCTAPLKSTGCSVSLPAGLRSNSTVTVSYTYSYYGWDHDTYSFSSGITANGVGALNERLALWDGEWEEYIMSSWVCSGSRGKGGAVNGFEGTVYCNMVGLTNGSVSVGIVRAPDWEYCIDDCASESGSCDLDCYDGSSQNVTYYFTVTY